MSHVPPSRVLSYVVIGIRSFLLSSYIMTWNPSNSIHFSRCTFRQNGKMETSSYHRSDSDRRLSPVPFIDEDEVRRRVEVKIVLHGNHFKYGFGLPSPRCQSQNPSDQRISPPVNLSLRPPRLSSVNCMELQPHTRQISKTGKIIICINVRRNRFKKL